jgi:hypothetical protein
LSLVQAWQQKGSLRAAFFYRWHLATKGGPLLHDAAIMRKIKQKLNILK